jgi:hypothetical protein
MAESWQVGDRCVIKLPNNRATIGPGRPQQYVTASGEVIGVDNHGMPGVEIRFIQPRTVNGCETCYATHDEPRRVR